MNEITITITEAELELKIENSIRKILETYKSSEGNNNPSLPRNFLKTSQATVELGVSRQTLINWSKQPRTKNIIAPYIQRIGTHLSYDVEGIKKVIEKNGLFFGGNRNYVYKELTSKIVDSATEVRYLTLQRKAFSKAKLDEADEKFYREQCNLRGDKCQIEKTNMDNTM